jgi:3',5'-cyclic AMP phosphodiesterase CpdA
MFVLTRRQFLTGASAVMLAASGCSKLRLPTPVGATPEPEAPGGPIRIALLSDTHVQETGSAHAVAINGKLSKAVADYREYRPHYWLVNGDVTDHGLPGEYAAFKRIMGSVARDDQLLVTTGNHEFYDKEASDEEALRRFRQAFGREQPYMSRVVGGVHLVLLADEQWKTAPRNPDWAWLTPAQLQWLERVLQEHRDKFTVVFLHQPLQDTVLWTSGGNGFAGSGQIQELRAILRKNPQVKLWFSGHTHHGVDAPGQVVRKDGVTYLGLGSTYYQFVPSEAPEDQGGWPSRGGFRKDMGVSQSRALEIWPDKVVVRARDHGKQAWLDQHEVVIPRG